MTEPVHHKPCSGCPYRTDCPSGVWAEEEYLKLAEYDKETGDQPVSIFLCHDGDRESTVCRGWLDTHDKNHLLALRFAMMNGMVTPEILDLPPSGVPMFSSGTEAMLHGLEELEDPSPEAIEMMDKLQKRHPELKTK